MTIGPATRPSCSDGPDLVPGLERPHLREASEWVRDAALSGVNVEQLPGNGGVQDLAERLHRLEAVPLGQLAPPGADLVGP
jgi:hypothetical protein